MYQANEGWVIQAVKIAQKTGLRIASIDSIPTDSASKDSSIKDSKPFLINSLLLDEPAILKLAKDAPLVDAFCRKYGVELMGININTDEFPAPGLLYYFSDQMGGYSREGLEASLREKLRIVDGKFSWD